MANPFKKPYTVTQPYGPTKLKQEPPFRGSLHYHCGIDMVAQPSNAAIYSITDGVVFAASTDNSDGAKYAIVKTGSDIYVAYWHLSSYSVKAGQNIKAGDQLGNQGATGNVTGVHLHLEIQQKNPYGKSLHNPNNCIDPTPFLADPGGGKTMSTSTDDYLKHPDKFAEKVWIWVLAEAFQGVEFGNYPDAAADGHVNAILNNASRAEIAAGFARDGGWYTPVQVQAIQQAKESAEQAARQLQQQLERADATIQQSMNDAHTATTRAEDAESALKALQNAPKGMSEAECQARVETAVQRANAATSRQYESNPWPAVKVWTVNRLADWATAIGNALKVGDR